MRGLELNHKSTVLVLRWLTVLLVILLMLYSQKGLTFGTRAYALGVVFLLSNIALALVPSRRFESETVSSIIVLADAAFVSLAIYLTSGFNTDFYLVYFLVIFIAAMRQDLKGSIMAGVVAVSLYGWFASRASSDFHILSTPFLIRGLFFLLVSTFSGFLVQAAKTNEKARKRAELKTRQLEARLQASESMSDISIRKARDLHSYNEAVLESISSGIVVVESSLKITKFNPGAQLVTGMSAKDVIDQRVDAIPAFQQGFAQTILDTLQMERQVTNRELELLHVSGRKIPLGVSTSILRRGNGEVLGAIAIFRDISEIKALHEKVRRSDRLALIGQMATCVAHEIRSPLTSISGFAQLLASKKRRENIDEYAKIIVREAERIDTTVRDILGWAKEMKIEKKPMDVNTVVVDVKASVQERARGCGISIETELDPDLPLILGDSDRLRGVIQNLSINAIQAMSEGGQLRLETASHGDYLVVAVSDTGEGISPEMQCQIWEPFFSTKKDGTGLGLAITRRVVEAHEGRINIDSSVGRGTRFVVELPINEVGAYAGVRG